MATSKQNKKGYPAPATATTSLNDYYDDRYHDLDFKPNCKPPDFNNDRAFEDYVTDVYNDICKQIDGIESRLNHFVKSTTDDEEVSIEIYMETGVYLTLKRINVALLPLIPKAKRRYQF
jgi:hypothetical protein